MSWLKHVSVLIVAAAATASWTLDPAGAAALAGSWQLNEGPGATRAHDATFHNNDGVIAGAQPGAAGVRGSAYRFRFPSIVTVRSAGSLNPGGANLTLSVWLRSDGLVLRASNPLINSPNVAQKGLSGTPGGNYKLELDPSAGGANAVAHCHIRGSRGSLDVVGTADVVNGRWHHVTCARIGSTVRLTVDGNAKSRTGSIGVLSNSAPFTMGAKASNGEDQFTGDLDDVTVTIG